MEPDQIDLAVPTTTAGARRIAFVTGNLALGGATTFLLNLGSELNASGAGVLVLNLEGPSDPEFELAGIALEPPPEGTRWFEERITWAIKRLGQFKPHTVVANLSPTSFEPLRYAPAGVKRIGMAHTDDPIVYQLIDRYKGWLDCTVAVSQRIKDELEKRGILAASAVHVAQYGVPMPPEDWVRKPNLSDPLRVLYLGRLSREQKRAELLPIIHAQVQAGGVETTWTIAGDGPLRRELEAQMSGRRVTFMGAVGYSGVRQLLQQHDTLLLPSAYEGLPLSLLEAMGCEVVPVVSNLPSGVGEVVGPTTGVLVDPADIQGYAQAIISLDRDRERLLSLGREGRSCVSERYSTAAMLRRWIPILSGTDTSEWLSPISVKPPLGAERSLRFFPPIRWLTRRLRAVLRRPIPS